MDRGTLVHLQIKILPLDPGMMQGHMAWGSQSGRWYQSFLLVLPP